MTQEQEQVLAGVHHALRQLHATADTHAALEKDILKIKQWLDAKRSFEND